MTSSIDTKRQDVPQQKRAASGVFRRLELNRLLRAASEAELRELLLTGSLDELLDADDGDASEFEY